MDHDQTRPTPVVILVVEPDATQWQECSEAIEVSPLAQSFDVDVRRAVSLEGAVVLLPKVQAVLLEPILPSAEGRPADLRWGIQMTQYCVIRHVPAVTCTRLSHYAPEVSELHALGREYGVPMYDSLSAAPAHKAWRSAVAGAEYLRRAVGQGVCQYRDQLVDLLWGTKLCGPLCAREVTHLLCDGGDPDDPVVTAMMSEGWLQYLMA